MKVCFRGHVISNKHDIKKNSLGHIQCRECSTLREKRYRVIGRIKFLQKELEDLNRLLDRPSKTITTIDDWSMLA